MTSLTFFFPVGVLSGLPPLLAVLSARLHLTNPGAVLGLLDGLVSFPSIALVLGVSFRSGSQNLSHVGLRDGPVHLRCHSAAECGHWLSRVGLGLAALRCMLAWPPQHFLDSMWDAWSFKAFEIAGHWSGIRGCGWVACNSLGLLTCS